MKIADIAIENLDLLEPIILALLLAHTLNGCRGIQLMFVNLRGNPIGLVDEPEVLIMAHRAQVLCDPLCQQFPVAAGIIATLFKLLTETGRDVRHALREHIVFDKLIDQGVNDLLQRKDGLHGGNLLVSCSAAGCWDARAQLVPAIVARARYTWPLDEIKSGVRLIYLGRRSAILEGKDRAKGAEKTGWEA